MKFGLGIGLTPVSLDTAGPPPPAAPTAVITYSVSGTDVSLSGLSSTAVSPATITGYAWTIAGPYSIVSGSLTSGTLVVRFPFASGHAVGLQVTDSNSNTGSTSTSVTTSVDANPTARITSVVTGPDVSLSASTSTAISPATLTGYAWTIAGSYIILSGTLTSANLVVRFINTGSHAVGLTVTDSNSLTGADTASPSTLTSAAPTAAFTSTAIVNTVTIDGTPSSAISPATIASYLWTITDPYTLVSGSLTSSVIVVTFTVPGSHSVTLQVTDSLSQTDSETHDVSTATVNPTSVPTAAALAPYATDVTLDGTGSYAVSPATITGYQWTIADPHTILTGSLTSATLQVRFLNAGTHVCSLQVTDSNSNTNTANCNAVTSAGTWDDVASGYWATAGTWNVNLVPPPAQSVLIDSHYVYTQGIVGTGQPPDPAVVLSMNGSYTILMSPGVLALGYTRVPPFTTADFYLSGGYGGMTNLLTGATIDLRGGLVEQQYQGDLTDERANGLVRIFTNTDWGVMADHQTCRFSTFECLGGTLTWHISYTNASNHKQYYNHWDTITVNVADGEWASGPAWWYTGLTNSTHYISINSQGIGTGITIAPGRTFTFSGERWSLSVPNTSNGLNIAGTLKLAETPRLYGAPSPHAMDFYNASGSTVSKGTGTLWIDGALTWLQMCPGVSVIAGVFQGLTLKITNGAVFGSGFGPSNGAVSNTGLVRTIIGDGGGTIGGGRAWNSTNIMGILRFDGTGAVCYSQACTDVGSGGSPVVQYTALEMVTAGTLSFVTNPGNPYVAPHRSNVYINGSASGSGELTVVNGDRGILAFLENATLAGGMLVTTGTNSIYVVGGKTLTLHHLTIDGTPKAPGTYAASAVLGFTDAGTIVVQN